MKFKEWLEEFLAEFERQAGYPLVVDEIFRERLETDYYCVDVSPRDAVVEEMSAEF